MLQKTIIRPDIFPFYDYRRHSLSLALKKGDYLFYSGHTASEYDPDRKRIVCKGGMIEQATLAFEKIKLLIEAAGGTFDDIVKITDYLTPEGLKQYESVAGVRRKYFRDGFPAMTQIVVHHLTRPDALIEIEAVAILGKAKKEVFNPGWATYEGLDGYPAVRKGDLLFISGQMGIDHRTGRLVAPRSLAAHSRKAYENIEAILKAFGADFDDVVKTLHYVHPEGLPQYNDVKEVRKQYFKNGYSALTTVVVEDLMPGGGLINVDCIAILGDAAKVSYGLQKNDPADATSRQAVRKGHLVFISGVTGENLEANEPSEEGDVIAQTKQVFVNAEKILRMAGVGVKDIVKTVDFVFPEAEKNYRGTADIRREIFRGDFPVSTGVYINQPIPDRALIQLDFIAVAD